MEEDGRGALVAWTSERGGKSDSSMASMVFLASVEYDARTGVAAEATGCDVRGGKSGSVAGEDVEEEEGLGGIVDEIR